MHSILHMRARTRAHTRVSPEILSKRILREEKLACIVQRYLDDIIFYSVSTYSLHLLERKRNIIHILRMWKRAIWNKDEKRERE